MEHLYSNLKRVVGYFKGRKEVSALYVYGGVGSGEYAGMGYGVGVLSSLCDPLIHQSLELDCRVQCEDVLDVVCLDTAPMGLRHHVARCGCVVYERNRAHRVHFESKVMNSYGDQIAMGYGLGSEAAGEIMLEMLEGDMGF